MPHIEDVLLWSLAQKGDKYIFGAEARASDPNPSAFDCSELVEWSCARAGVQPTMPDGADNQRIHCQRKGMEIPVGQALRTRGALLFVGDNTGTGRDRTTHVAWSLGDGTTIEARGAKWGVGTWPSTNRFDFAALVPGVDYSPGHGQLEDDMYGPDERDELVKRLDAIKGGVDELFKKAVASEATIKRLDEAIDDLDDSAPGGLSKADVKAAVREVFADAAKP